MGALENVGRQRGCRVGRTGTGLASSLRYWAAGRVYRMFISVEILHFFNLLLIQVPLYHGIPLTVYSE